MENENVNYTRPEAPSIIPVAVRYGLITGLVMIIYNLILFFTGTFGAWYTSVLGLIIVILAIVMAHNQYKKINGGFMSYGKGLGIGTLTYGIAGILTGLFLFVYMSFIDPTVMDSMLEAQVEMMENFNLTEEQMDKMIADFEEKNTPIRNLLTQSVGGFFIGFFLSLIIAAITKRNRPEFE